MRTFFYSVTAILLLISFTSFSQSHDQEVDYADRFYAAEDYFLASEHYLKAYNKDVNDMHSAYHYAQCERKFFNYEQAEKFYKIVYKQDNKGYPLALYYYALMLKNNAKYLAAEAAFVDFIATYNGDNTDKIELASLHYNGCVVALEAAKKPKREYFFENVGEPVNSFDSDFSPSIYKNDTSIVIASSRKEKKNAAVYAKLGGGFLDEYYFELREEGWMDITEEAHDDFEKINTKDHDGAGVFNSDRSKFYFTRCDVPGKRKGDKECAIYVTKKNNNSIWGVPILLNENVNMPTEYNAQPALTASDDTLYFASKRPEGFGESDIWMSIKTEEENWGEAKNLGDKINSSRFEMSPNYYSEENILFFSSDGHESMGGLDIFMAKGDSLDELRNVGLPFNSNKDDFHFALGEKKGYLSSNRDGGFGHDDIYTFNIVSKHALIAAIYSDTTGASSITIRGIIKNDDKTPAEGIVVVLRDTSDAEIMRTRTNEEGKFVFENLDPSKDYQIFIEEDNGSLTTEIKYSIDSLEVEGEYKAKEQVAKLISISGVILDENGNPQSMEEVVLTDHEGRELQTTHTDEKGEFIFANLDPTIDYKVMLRDPETGKLKEVDFNDGIIVLGTDQKLNTTSLEVASTGAPSRVLFENIYFDFNKSNLRKESRIVLGELVAYAKANPKLKIEVNGHTDGVGGVKYNIGLGKERGSAAYKYLTKSGISRSQIVVNSLGEGNPLATNNHPVGRQLNRRVEFYIVGGGDYSATAKIYVLTPNTSIDEIASRFNMTVSELESLNGGPINTNQTYVPIRVRRSGDEGVVSKELLNMKASDYEIKGGGKPNDVSYNKGVFYNKYDGGEYYIVSERNSLYSIAKICGTTIAEIKALNGMKSNFIYKGQKLRVRK